MPTVIEAITDSDKSILTGQLRDLNMTDLVATHRRLHQMAARGASLKNFTRADMNWFHAAAEKELRRRAKDDNRNPPDPSPLKWDSASSSESSTTAGDAAPAEAEHDGGDAAEDSDGGDNLVEHFPSHVKAIAARESTEPGPVNLAEKLNLAEATSAPLTGERLRIQLINEGWGSSGYYSAEVLREAADSGVFPAGLHMYLDHPTVSEETERPERSVRDLAAALATDATYDPKARGLVAEAEVFGPYRALLAEMADHIGVSIRANGLMTRGEAEGREGPIITALTEAASVDFVTAAGRGGRITALLESARGHVAREAVANDVARALGTAVDNAYPSSDTQYAWMCDYDAEKRLVYFHWRLGSDYGTYQRSYTLNDDGTASLTGDPQEVTVSTVYTPVSATQESDPHSVPAPAGQSTTSEESRRDPMSTVQVEETRLRQLEEDAGRVQPLEAKRDQLTAELDTTRTELAETREQLAAEKARTYARDYGIRRVREANSELPQRTVEKIVDEAMREIPLTAADDKGQRRLDTDAFNSRVDEAQKAEEAYLSEISETTGRIRGLGGDGGPAQLTEAEFQSGLQNIFGDLGMDENTAKLAAKGR